MQKDVAIGVTFSKYCVYIDSELLSGTNQTPQDVQQMLIKSVMDYNGFIEAYTWHHRGGSGSDVICGLDPIYRTTRTGLRWSR